MWLKLALKATLLFIISACSPSEKDTADKLNSLSYTYHYRDIDSTESYARQALNLSVTSGYADGRAEALNNLAFANIIRMRYDKARGQLDSIVQLTDNQLELLVADIQQMRLCQRCSRNREFYDFREQAYNALRRIDEERHQLDERQRQRLLYAESELAIVSSTYYYYVGLERQSVDELLRIPADVVSDTALWLNYLYNVGAGGFISGKTQQEVEQQEMEHLLRCLQVAQRCNYRFFEANALEGIAEHLTEMPSDSSFPMAVINQQDVPADQLPTRLAENALAIFQDYGDVYQIAGAFRTLASCYRAKGDYEKALYYLEQALSDTTILQAPDLVASIREQMSVAYAAIDDKPKSDYNRNIYLDLQEQTRQDRQLEARADQLKRAVTQLNWILAAVVVSCILLVFLLWLFRYLYRHQKTESPLDEQIEERREQLAANNLHIEEGERRHLEQRAKISLVNSLLPIIDRMVYAIGHLKSDAEHADASSQNAATATQNVEWTKGYICELTQKIENDNEVLTHWIQLQQGQLSIRIESFSLQPLFDMVARSSKSFQLKGITLQVVPTQTVVKADRILTLFMLNTLADNARKFTSEGGNVIISAEETTDYVEISVKDTGVGMNAEQLAHVFDRQVISDDRSQASHGFGLLNCKGIIEKYRKLSQFFNVCTLQADSEVGMGSRFFFRLPKGLVHGVVCLLLATTAATAATPSSSIVKTALERAAVYADSAYFCNINGQFERTIDFADSCRTCLNEHYRQQRPQGKSLLIRKGDTSVTPPEILWLHDSVNTNYSIILDIRNETAVAALALHQWHLYTYNNRIYTQLFKELSADASLADYCRTMQQTKSDRVIALVLLSLVFLSILPAYYYYLLRPRLHARFMADKQRREDFDMLEDELHRTDLELANLHVSNAVLDNCLSTLKHETMYYPSRISMLVGQNDLAAISEVAGYYRELYNMLSMQAMSQTERVKLHLHHLEHDILGDQTLIRYLFDILKKQSGQKQIDVSYRRLDAKYVEVAVRMPSLRLAAGQEQSLFSPSTENIPYLLCRQIVRDHGEATNLRGCSIRTETKDNQSNIIIILPAYGKI